MDGLREQAVARVDEEDKEQRRDQQGTELADGADLRRLSVWSKTGLLREGKESTKGTNGRVPPDLSIWSPKPQSNLHKMEACENTNSQQPNGQPLPPDNCGSSSTMQKHCSG